MKIAYCDFYAGVTAEKLLAALMDAGASPEMVNDRLITLGLPPLPSAEPVTRCGLRALLLSAPQPASQGPPMSYRQVDELLDQGPGLSTTVQRWGRGVWQACQQAESQVAPARSVDASRSPSGCEPTPYQVALVLACCLALESLQVAELHGSPLSLGTGWCDTPHGRFVVPGPVATALLRNVPLAENGAAERLTDLVGAALLRSLQCRFGNGFPPMVVEQVGSGAGATDWPTQAHLLRVMLGPARQPVLPGEQAIVLETNLDDCSAEVIGFALEKLFAAGAWDCYTTAIQMKKSRPGTQLTVIAQPALQPVLEQILFAETPTLGIRIQRVERTILPRQIQTWQSPWGPIRVKVATLPDGSRRAMPEYEDCRQVALRTGVPVAQVLLAAQQAPIG